jgi:hypothetical protein
MGLGTMNLSDRNPEMKRQDPNPTTIRCSICHHLYDPSTRGAGIEVGTPRRFCPKYFSDILRVNCIREDDFLDEIEIIRFDELD